MMMDAQAPGLIFVFCLFVIMSARRLSNAIPYCCFLVEYSKSYSSTVNMYMMYVCVRHQSRQLERWEVLPILTG
jgi:hypothetical protein